MIHEHNAAVGQLVVVTGPPGAGKSSVSEELANTRAPSALVPGDSFFAMIKQGYVLPWLPQARHQNTVVIEAAASSAGRLSDMCFVVYDGIVGPWFLQNFVRAAGTAEVHYAILLPPLEACLDRVRTRVDHGFSDLAVTRDMHQQFANADIDTRHVITKSDDSPAGMAERIAGRLSDGEFRYSHS